MPRSAVERRDDGGVIQYRYIDGRWCPFFVCHTCGENITESGNIDHLVDAETGATVAGPYALHKGSCSRRLRASTPVPAGAMWLWDELETFLSFLIGNTGIDVANADQIADLLSGV